MRRFYRGVGSLSASHTKRSVEAITDRAVAVGEGTPLTHPTLGKDVGYKWGSFHEGAVRLAEALIADLRRQDSAPGAYGPPSDAVLAREQLVRFPAPVYMNDESYNMAVDTLANIWSIARSRNLTRQTVHQDPADFSVYPDELGNLVRSPAPTGPRPSSGRSHVPVRYPPTEYETEHKAGGPFFADWALRSDALGEWTALRQGLHGRLARRLRSGRCALVVDVYGSLAEEARALVGAEHQGPVVVIGGADAATPTAGQAAGGATEAGERSLRMNLCLCPKGIRASEYATTLAAAYLDAAVVVGGDTEDDQTFAEMLEDWILTVVLANEALLAKSASSGEAGPADRLLSFGALSQAGLLAGEGSANHGLLEEVIDLLEDAPVSSEGEEQRRSQIVEGWRRWQRLHPQIRRARVEQLSEQFPSVTLARLSKLFAQGVSPVRVAGGVRYEVAGVDDEPTVQVPAGYADLDRLDARVLTEGAGPEGSVVVADLSALGYRSTAARSGSGLLLRLASEEVRSSYSVEDVADATQHIAAIATTAPAIQIRELDGRALGVRAMDRLAELDVLDDSASRLILKG